MAFTKSNTITLLLNLFVIFLAALTCHFATLTGFPALALLLLFFMIPNLIFRIKFWTEEQDLKTLQTFFAYDMLKQFLAFIVYFFITFLALFAYMDYFFDLKLLIFEKYLFTLLFSPLMFIVMRSFMKSRLTKKTMFTKERKKKK